MFDVNNGRYLLFKMWQYILPGTVFNIKINQMHNMKLLDIVLFSEDS